MLSSSGLGTNGCAEVFRFLPAVLGFSMVSLHDQSLFVDVSARRRRGL